jgi:hypothetical protein
VLPSRIDGINTERNAPVGSLGKINTLDPPPLDVEEVATHPVAPSVPRQLIKSPANVLPRAVSIQPPMDTTFIVPDPMENKGINKY